MCHVLVIEDELLIALDIEDILSRNGATSVDRVETQDEAVLSADRRRPDVITSDVALRIGRGPLAIEEITSRHGLIPVIYITSMPDGCEPDGTTRVLVKPVSEAAIAQAFRALRPLA